MRLLILAFAWWCAAASSPTADLVPDLLADPEDVYRIGANIFNVLEASTETSRVAADTVIHAHPHHDTVVSYTFELKQSASSLAALPVRSITNDETTPHDRGPVVVLALDDDPRARAKTFRGALLVAESEAQQQPPSGTPVIDAFERIGMHRLDHGQGDAAPRPLAQVFEVIGDAPETSAPGTFAVLMKPTAPATLFRRAHVELAFNHTTSRAVRRRNETDFDEDELHRRLSDVCDEQCDSYWNGFYQDWLEDTCTSDDESCALCITCFEWEKSTDVFSFNFDSSKGEAEVMEYTLLEMPLVVSLRSHRSTFAHFFY